MARLIAALLSGFILCAPFAAAAQELNTVPTARMDEAGTASLSLATLDPYAHAVLGMQIAEPLYIGLRQSAEISDIGAAADRLLPGIDVRLRLARESAWMPETVIGLRSAAGHKRMAGEYLALSKRYNDFDFTAGIGWGRFAEVRSPESEAPNGPEDWFGGSPGIFGGVSYQTPLEPLSLQFDWSADRYNAEKEIAGFDPPAPWSAGFTIRPAPWFDIGAAIAGGEKIMAKLNLRAPVQKWAGRNYKDEAAHTPFRRYRTGLIAVQAMEDEAARDGIGIHGLHVAGRTAAAGLDADGLSPLPRQAGRAARAIANHAGEEVEEIRIVPAHYGLKGPSVRLIRRDLEAALRDHNGSPDEIWRNVEFGSANGALEPGRKSFRAQLADNIRIILDTKASLAEEDSGILYRTGIIFSALQQLPWNFVAGAALRLNLKDNLDKLDDVRPRTAFPTRGDEADFAGSRLAAERSFIGWMKTVRTDLHVALAAGQLEEMYSGAGGEILYRPFGKTFAIGVEGWAAAKRDPFSPMHGGLTGDGGYTAHINAWYEFANTGLTAGAEFGKYLGGDTGGTLALTRNFGNGAQGSAFVTATDAADADPFGGITHLYGGLQFRLPLGNIRHVPQGTEARLRFAQIGRNAGQTLDSPLPLYEMTEPLSYRHMATHWKHVTD